MTALDQFNNTAIGYTGTVHFSSTDGQASLPDDVTLVNGSGFFAAALKTAGSHQITATDTVSGPINGTSNPVAVSVAALHHFGLSAPATAATGSAFNVTVTAQDAYNNTVISYVGTVQFNSSDGAAGLPSNGTLVNGVRDFSVTLKTAGSQSLTVRDTVNASITGSSNIVVRDLVVNSFTLTPTGFNIGFNKPFDPAPLNLYDAASALGATDVALGLNAVQTITFAGLTDGNTFTLSFNNGSSTATTTPITYSSTPTTLASRIQSALNNLSTIGPNNTLVNALSATNVAITFQNGLGFRNVALLIANPAGPAITVTQATIGLSAIRGSLLLNTTNTGFTFVKTGTGVGGVLAAGTYQLTLRTDSLGFKDLAGVLLDGNSDGVTGDNYVTSFVVATTPSVILSAPDFGRGPDSIYNVRVPNNIGGETDLITFSGTPDGSTFKLTFNGVSTPNLTYSTHAATLQRNIQGDINSGDPGLDTLSTIGAPRRSSAIVTAIGTDSSGVATSATVVFANLLGGLDLQPTYGNPALTTTDGTGVSVSRVTRGVNMGIPITLSGATGVNSVEFDLHYNPALLTITGTYNASTTAGPTGSTFTMTSNSGGVAHFVFSIGSAPRLARKPHWVK